MRRASCTAVTLASLPGPDGQTSLREAVCAANNTAGPDTITFAVNGTFALTGAANEDNGGSGDLDIKDSLAINGNGAANTIIDGGGIERIFDVFPSAASTFDLSNLTVQNGDTRSNSFKEGGAMYLHNNVTTTITGSRIVNNFSGANGAIENRGTLTINNSVISNNQTIPASGSVVGGGIRNAGALTINNTTISNNSVRGRRWRHLHYRREWGDGQHQQQHDLRQHRQRDRRRHRQRRRHRHHRQPGDDQHHQQHHLGQSRRQQRRRRLFCHSGRSGRATSP